MSLLVVDCPHCGARKMTMQIVGHGVPPPRDEPHFCVFAMCGDCSGPVSARVKPPANWEIKTWDAFERVAEEAADPDTSYSLSAGGFAIEIVHSQPNTEAPAHLPAAAARAYRGAEATWQISDAGEQAATGFRGAVEKAIKETRPDIKGSLQSRIDQLEQEGAIPKVLKDWAHEVRLIGNAGAHDIEELQPGDLEAVRGFAEAFLRYFITLPRELEIRREAARKAADEDAAQ